MVSLKLAINPGPEKLSYQTLHRKLGPVWKKLRVMRNPGFCEICNWRQPDKPSCGDALRMHEVFDYKIKRRGKSVAYLRDLQFLCNRCHGIVHNGHVSAKLIQSTEQLLLRGSRFKAELEAALAKFEETVKHFCNINRCSRDDFFRHAEQAAAKKRKRDSVRAWRIDWTIFDPKDVEEFVIKHAR
jgi:hypothetical protein